MTALYQEFLAAYPEYGSTDALDALRAREYRRLDDQQHVYLDYTGGSLHGFRRADTIVRCLEAELYFYGAVFAFTPAGSVAPIEIDNLR